MSPDSSSNNTPSGNTIPISKWLSATHSSNPTPAYRHTRLSENAPAWAGVSAQVECYFKQAHRDAIERLRRVTSVSLHPAGAASSLPPPYRKYPFGLPDITLQGYFGEILAGLLAESIGAAGHDDWEVPAHLFHVHMVAFQQLEQQGQTGVPVTTIFGRTGDDCLAFRRDSNGRIISVLFCESKCTRTHDAQLVADAHDKAAKSAIVDIMQLVEALDHRNCPVATEWANALRILHSGMYASPPAHANRCDAVYYVHGQTPRRTQTWISPQQPHSSYTAGRSLHTVEVHLSDVLARVRSIYQSGVWV
jgi:hypothetical protein